MENFENACCFTGYRPEKFDFPFETDCEPYRVFLERLYTAVAEMIEKGCTVFYTGMATGFDIAAAEYVALVKKLNKSIRLIAVVPFEGQEKRWNDDWQRRYHELLAECDEKIVLEPHYTSWAFDRRNRYMVDHSRYCITYFDGKKGGTANTVAYALKNGREVLNIYDTDPLAESKERYKVYAHLYPPEVERQEPTTVAVPSVTRSS